MRSIAAEFTGLLSRLAWTVFRSFVATLLVVALIGVVLAGLSYYFLRSQPVYGLIAAWLAAVEGIIAGVFLGSRRALIAGLVEGVRKLALGRSAVRLIFQRLLGVMPSPDTHQADSGQQATDAVSTSEAERGIHDSVTTLVHDSQGSRLRRKLRDYVLRLVEKYALTRVHQQGQGTVDLYQLQADLESRIDKLLIDKLRQGLWRVTALVLIVLVLVVAAQALIFSWLSGHG